MKLAQTRNMRDIRTLRSVRNRSGPADDGAAFLELHRLATERDRLEREVGMWVRKKEQIERRLSEIEEQMQLLRQSVPAVESQSRAVRKPWQQVTLEY